MLGAKSSEEQSYSKGYQDGLKKMQQQTERRIALNPNDKDAVRDLNLVKEELSKVSLGSPEKFQSRTGDDAKRYNTNDASDSRNTSEDHDSRQRRI